MLNAALRIRAGGRRPTPDIHRDLRRLSPSASPHPPIVEEFDRLRRDEAAPREIRAAFVRLAASHFPRASSLKLLPLLRRGCEDPEAEVREAALESLEELFGTASERKWLQSLATRHTLEIGRDAMECLRQLDAKTKGADPNPVPDTARKLADPPH